MAHETDRRKQLWGLALAACALGVVALLDRIRTEGAPSEPSAKTATPPVADKPVAETPAEEPPVDEGPILSSEGSTVKWVYDKSLLILLSQHGVGAAAFTESIENGIVYSYRFESRDGRTKRSGTGRVFERYKVKQTKEDGSKLVENDGGELVLNAGRVWAQWSIFSPYAGWVYAGTGTEVRLLPLEPLDKLDLHRAALRAVRESPREPEPRPVPDLGSANANWIYEKNLLILVAEEGVSAVAFTEAIDDGIVYSFRFESRDGTKKVAGSDKAFERHPKPGTVGTAEVFAKGSRLFIQAGPLRVGWSLGSRSDGWVYYTPSHTDAQFVPVEPLGTIDLRKFVR